MAAPTPHTWAGGEKPTSPNMQTLTDTGLFVLGSTTSTSARKDLAVLRQTTFQSIPNAAFTALTFDTEDADYASGHSTVSNTTQYVGKNAGWHIVTAVYATTSNATGRRIIGIRKNGTGTNNPTDARSDANAAAAVQVFTVTGMVYLNGTTDYIEAVCYQDSTAALNTVVATTDAQSRLEVLWVSN